MYMVTVAILMARFHRPFRTNAVGAAWRSGVTYQLDDGRLYRATIGNIGEV